MPAVDFRIKLTVKVGRTKETVAGRQVNQKSSDTFYESEFAERGFEVVGPFPAGPVSFRLKVLRKSDDEEFVADLISETREPQINLLCQNSSLFRGLAADERVIEIIDCGWFEDGSYFQITDLPVSSAPVAETQPHEMWTETDFWFGARDLLQVLLHLHRREIVHGAFSPWTLYQSLHGVKLSDFWWAHNAEGMTFFEALTDYYLDLLPLGCLPYTAPEVLRGHAPSRNSDLFSLGAVLFFVLTGSMPRKIEKELPADADKDDLRAAWADAHRLHIREFRPRLDPLIYGVVESLLTEDPSERIDAFDLEDFIQSMLEPLREDTKKSGWYMRPKPADDGIDVNIRG